ncbi:hypothetical protein ACLB2K_074362 [Fragaria x ananassa]
MELLLPSSICDPTTIIAFLLVLFSVVRISIYLQKNTAKNREPPKAAGAWPIFGHLPLLGGPQPPHMTLGNMADKYGPLFTIKLGVHRALVVSSWDVAKECLTTNDKAFADRPKALGPEIMGYNAMFGFSPYGPYWRQVRKLTTLHILSNHKLKLLEHVRASEVKMSTRLIFDMWEQNKGVSNKVLVEMKRWFGDLTLNVMFRMVVGKRFSVANSAQENVENEIFRKALGEFLRLGGEFIISDAVPYLRWLDLGGYEKAMKKTAKELDGALQKWLEEHKQKRSTNSLHDVDGENDFMDMMLTVLDDDSREEFAGSITPDTINKATCLGVLLGGTDTTTVTLTWALALLLNNPEVLKKAQLELDNHVGKERQVNESDVKNLVYLQAIIKETLRLYPAGSLPVPHESREDCTVGNYCVTAGTRLLINISKIQRDPNVWLDPYLFKPERFLTTHKDVDVRGHSFEFIPFGSGRRICPGITLALQVTLLTLAHLLHGFEITPPSDEPVDMRESSGITNMKTTPLEVLLTPRLHPKLYDNVD